MWSAASNTISVVVRAGTASSLLSPENVSHRFYWVQFERHPLGLISDGAVVLRVAPQEQKGVLAALRRIGQTPPSQTTAQKLMSPGVLTARPDTSLVVGKKMMHCYPLMAPMFPEPLKPWLKLAGSSENTWEPLRKAHL